MDTNDPNTKLPVDPTKADNLGSLPTSHLPTIPLPPSAEPKKDPIPVVVPSTEGNVALDTSNNTIDLPKAPEPVIELPAQSPSTTEVSPIPATPEPKFSSQRFDPMAKLDEAPMPAKTMEMPKVVEPELMKSADVLKVDPPKKPVIPSSPDPVFISGPAKKSKNVKVLFKYLSLILGGLLFIGIVLAGYVFLKDMNAPEEVPVTPQVPIVEVEPTVKPQVDNTSLDALESYFSNVNRELKSLEEKSSFETSMNLFGSELR